MTLVQKHLDRLKGRTAWITGGKRIGQTVARALAEQGVNIITGYRHSETEALATVACARALGVQALAVRTDVSLPASVQAAVEQVRAEFPQIHILVNMASVYRPGAIAKVTATDWEENFAAHVLGTFFPTQFIVPLMPPGSHIINIADITSIGKPQKSNLPYVVTKAAVASLTRTMALEYGGRGLFVNALAPGPILPPDDFPRDRWQRIRGRAIVQYPVSDEEAVEQFALLVLYLSITTMTTGRIYPLDQSQEVS
ncbi:MAG: SDR family oxidoreductase [Acidobacteria bacterium]|nr:SDR family oxidoreductase [Acidobacteriota bacterium]